MKRLKLQQIKLECGKDATVNWNSKTKCEDCKEEIYLAVINNKQLIKIELVGVAEWDLHICKKKGGNNGKNK